MAGTMQPVYERILMDAAQIAAVVDSLAERIDRSYAACEPLLALVVLEGARRFADDLLSRMQHPVEPVFISTSSYHGGTHSAGIVKIVIPPALGKAIGGRHILLIDDIYDTGLTLSSLAEQIKQFAPASLKTCVLLEKKTPHKKPLRVDFLGFTVEDTFVVGYGLDYRNQYRDLPFIAALRKDLTTG